MDQYYRLVYMDDELKHYGVKGMHWGIRRYQPYTSSSKSKKIKNNLSYKGKTLSFKKKEKDSNIKEDLEAVNSEDRSNDQNCLNCTFAYELRRRGYDVRANFEVPDMQDAEILTKKCFKGAKYKSIPGYGYYDLLKNKEKFDDSIQKANNGKNFKLAEAAISHMSKQPDSRGQIAILWDGKNGHSFIYEVRNNKPFFLDGQSGKMYSDNGLKSILSMASCVDYTRLDNLDVNEKEMKKMVH